MIPSLDGKRIINGVVPTCLNGGGGGYVSTICTSTNNATTSTTTAIIDTSQVLQFRALLPSTTSTTGKQNQPSGRPSLVMQSSSAPTENATLTCLGTLVTGAGGAAGGTMAPQQVIVYSLAPHQAQQLSIVGATGGSGAAATLVPAMTLQPPLPPPAPPPLQVLPPLPPQPHLPTSATQTPTMLMTARCVCLWDECRKAFPSADRLFSHVYSAHFTPLRGQQEVVSTHFAFVL